MFISPAFAEEAAGTAAAAPPGTMLSLLPIMVIVLVFYFVVLRPQSKRFQDHRTMIMNLQKGDKVVTGGGIVATVVKLVGDDEVVLKISNDVEVTALRSTIMMLRNPKTVTANK